MFLCDCYDWELLLWCAPASGVAPAGRVCHPSAADYNYPHKELHAVCSHRLIPRASLCEVREVAQLVPTTLPTSLLQVSLYDDVNGEKFLATQL
jgi:hypothetical protein